MVKGEMDNKDHVYSKESCIHPGLLPLRAFALLSSLF